MTDERRQRVLAISSGGGHWVQLLRVVPAFADQCVSFVTVDRCYRTDVLRLAETDHRCTQLGKSRFRTVWDATRWNKFRMVVMSLQVLWSLVRERPDVVISTGAAPGYVAIRLAKLMRRRTIWIDSIANVEEVSMSGRIVGKHADLWLTQWPHLASKDGPMYRGEVV